MSRPLSLALCTLLTVAGCYADTVTVYFTGLPSTYENGSYNGYATAIVDGIPNQSLICDYYYGETYVPSPTTMIYDYSTLTGANPLQYAMWDTATPATPANVQKYEEAAVLLYDLSLAGPNPSANTVTDYQYALWNLMDPTAPLDATRTTQEQALQSAAFKQVTDPTQQAFLSANIYVDLRIYTPTAAFSTNQEFLALSPVTVPEPSTLSLIAGIFFGALAGLLATRRNRLPQHKLVQALTPAQTEPRP